MTVASQRGMLSSGCCCRTAYSSEEHQHVQQAELRHRACDRAQKHADGSCEKQVKDGADHEQRDRAGNREFQEHATHEIERQPDRQMITNPLAHIFDIAISKGVSGITSRWSIVPCSRSRTRAAPARMIASMVTLLMIPMTLMNHAVVILG